jgi:hypothetical protein
MVNKNLGIQGATVAGLLHTQDSLDPSNDLNDIILTSDAKLHSMHIYLMRRWIRWLIQVNNSTSNIIRNRTLEGRTA